MADENVKRSVFEANAALNAQEFANRQILLKGNGLPAQQAPFGATYLDESTNPPKLYRQLDSGVGSNWVTEGSGGTAINGAVFISDIIPQNPSNNVGQKTFSSDGKVLETAISNTDLITVEIIAAMGHSNYKPQVTVKGQAVPLVQDEDQSIWTGSIDIDLEGDVEVLAEHEDGASHLVNIQKDVGPVLSSVLFTGAYPGDQSELKEGDQFQVEVISDAEMTRIEVEDYGAAQAEVFDFAAASTKIINITIADRGDVAQNLGVRLRAMNANGSFGDPLASDSLGSDDGQHLVVVNNLHPSGIIDAIEYPVDQLALKENEEARVDIAASDYDQILYSSPNGELSIVDDNVYEPFKVVTRASGDYNVSVDNVRVTLTRTANAAVTELNQVVQIANVDPQISIVEPVSRLRSGGNQGTQVQNHEIALSSNQELIEAPVISVPHGTLEGVMTNESGNKINWTQNLRVHDDDEKGVFQFSLTSAKNLAGKQVNVLSGDVDYELGGFVSRTIVVPAFANEIDLGVNVEDTSKVVARDKDTSLLTYKNDLTDQLKTYAITGPSNTLNVKGNLFHWTDQQAVNNNSTGLATITIEEIV